MHFEFKYMHSEFDPMPCKSDFKLAVFQDPNY